MWPWNKQGIASPNLNVTPQQRQYFAGTDWRSQMSPVNAWSNANAPSMNALDQDIANVAANTSQFDAGYTGDDEDVPGMGKKAIDYRDDPVDFMMRANHPTRFDPLVNAKNFAQEVPGKIKSGITGILNNTLIGRLMGGLKNSFQDRPLGTSNVVDEFGNVFDSEDLDKQNALGGYYTDAARSSRRATSRYNNMLERKALGKKYSTINLAKMRAVLEKQRELDNRGYSGTPRGNTGSGAFAKFDNTTKDYGPHSKGGGPSNQGSGSFSGAGAGTGAQGPAGGQSSQGNYGGGRRDGPSGFKADGGRIGYENGELVEQETDFIQGPQGNEEFQETVVEGQAQPSREQLEALSMEIFQLPLDDLDDQQLLVVYQEAMQGQPMEEAVQEEDVQFAANGGLAGLL